MIILRAEDFPGPIADPFQGERVLFYRPTDEVEFTYWVPSDANNGVHFPDDVSSSCVVKKVDGYWISITVNARLFTMMDQHHRRGVAGCD